MNLLNKPWTGRKMNWQGGECTSPKILSGRKLQIRITDWIDQSQHVSGVSHGSRIIWHSTLGVSREHDSACGGVLRATVGLRGSAACWLGRLRFWPRPSDGLDTTEGLLGPGSGMTMCADLDSAPRPPTLTKDATLECAVVKLYRIYAHKVWVDYGIWTYTITKWYTFENVRGGGVAV